MVFKKKPAATPRRRRSPIAQRSGPSVVFSYHSARSGESKTSQPRRAKNILEIFDRKPKATNSIVKNRLPSQLKTIVALAAVLLLGWYCLTLKFTPKVVVLADVNSSGQALLQPMDVYNQAAKQAMAASIFNTNKLTINTTAVAGRFQKQFAELDKTSVVLPLMGRQPVFYIQPARPALLLKTTAGTAFILNASGRAMEESVKASAVAKLGLPVVDDQSGLPVSLGKTALSSDSVAFISEVVGQLKAKKLAIATMTLPKDNPGELDMMVSGDPYFVKFNLHGVAKEQAGAYLAVRSYLTSQNKTAKTYVDVRVENKAFYQ